MKKYILLVIITGCLALNSCKKDFLDVTNTQNLYRESYVKDLPSMQEYLNGAYLTLARYFEEGMGAAYPELAGDNLRPITITSSTLMIPHYNWVQVSDGTDFQFKVGSNLTATAMDPLWLTGYTIIRICNFVVEDVDKYRSENPAHADDMKGQALSLRAYIFFRLVNTFAQTYSYTQDASHPGIPYITTSDITQPFSRQTVAEVYAGMITDLTNSIQLLSENVTSLLFMNRNAAKALLARIYLFKEDYVKAKTQAAEIAAQIPLMTITAGYPDAVFKFRSPAQTETLFQIRPNYTPAFQTLFLSTYLRYAGLKRFVATNDIASILREDTNDVRKGWISYVSNQWNVIKFPINSAPEASPAITVPELAYYPAIIRSSEMFLTVAEASAKTGDENTARVHLDAIRQRANSLTPSITATGTALLDSIYKERRKELAFESLRMYDLQRWKKGVARIDVMPGSPASLLYPHDKAIAPIPLSDVKVAGLTQNPGY